ncbi:MAG: TylF/MycF/NovP-related O-methyltransferase [Dehalococcoidia bacterium]|jgi:hypothetical protein|nr:TylF/MycF/NovP-related O-methyltransferase [Dehalococcoidia bacterium]
MKSWLKSRLRSVRGKVASRLLPSEVTFGLNRNDRTGALHRAWGHIFSSHIKGAYYELGVYRGDTFRASFRIYQDYAEYQRLQLTSAEPWRRKLVEDYVAFRHNFYAFDTFQGMPRNYEGSEIFREGTFLCSLEEFTRLNLASGMAEGDQIRYFAGTFAEVAGRQAADLEALQPAAIVNLDCDLYSSAKDALDLVTTKLVQGGVLMADDWNTFAASRDNGERRAVAEWLAEHPGITLEPWFAYYYTGQAFLVHTGQ